MTTRISLIQRVLPAAAMGALIVLGGCGSSERERAVAQSFTQARLAIDVAKSQDAKQHAQGELAIAEEKLREAREAAARGNHQRAERLLAETLVNIELARAKVDAERTKAKLEQADTASEAPSRGTVPSR